MSSVTIVSECSSPLVYFYSQHPFEVGQGYYLRFADGVVRHRETKGLPTQNILVCDKLGCEVTLH